MAAQDFEKGLSELIARRRLADGEFSYVFLATGDEVAGKKAVYKLLKNDEAVFEEFKDEHILEGETELAFDSRALKMLPNVPFEEDSSDAATSSCKTNGSSSSSKPVIKRDWETATKVALANLVARRRLEGGEFVYVWIPLEKTVSGKKAVFKFMKSQVTEYNQLVKACKDPEESLEQFESKILQQLLVVPYEKDVEDVEPTPGDKRKAEGKEGGAKKARLEPSNKGPGQVIFVEIEVLCSAEYPHQMIQLGAASESKRFFQPMAVRKMTKLGDTVLATIGMKKSQGKISFLRGKSEVSCVPPKEGLEKFLTWLKEIKANDESLTLVTYRRWSVLLDDIKKAGLKTKFLDIVTRMTSLEEMVREKNLRAFIPLGPLEDLYKRLKGSTVTMPKPCSEDLAFHLRAITVKMATKHQLKPSTLAKPSESYVEEYPSPPPFKGRVDVYCLVNSQNFNKRVMLHLEASDASTSKIGSQAPGKTQSQGATATKKVQQVVEKENFNFGPVATEVVYPVFCQPILVALNTLDENTKFVKFTLNKAYQSKANAADWELLRDSARVFWKAEKPFAFTTICPNLPTENRNKSGMVEMVETLPAGNLLGQYKELNKTDEEQRNLSTKVSVDLVVTQGPGNPAKLNITKAPSSILVTLVMRQGSLTEGNVKEFEFRPNDVLICLASSVPGIEVVNKFVSVDRKQAVPNRAKVVVVAKGSALLKSGQILCSAILFQNDVKLLGQKHTEQSQLTEQLAGGSNKLQVLQVKNSKKRPMVSMADSRLYSQGSNPLLVKLDQFEATKISGKFSKAYVQFSDDFKKVIAQNQKVLRIEKLSEEEAVVPVFWRRNIPYAFINIKIPANAKRPTIDFCDIVAGYELGDWTPMDTEVPAQKQRSTMSVCVDFTANAPTIQDQPTLVTCYLKFKDCEIDKEKVIESVFNINKFYNKRLEFLSGVVKPFAMGRLAPQKTATNDMKVRLVLRSLDGGPVSLNAREVIADCSSPDSENLNQFKVCGKKVRSHEMPPGYQGDMEMEHEMRGNPRGRMGMSQDDMGRRMGGTNMSRDDIMDAMMMDMTEQYRGRGGGRDYPAYPPTSSMGYEADADYMDYNDRMDAMERRKNFMRGASMGAQDSGVRNPAYDSFYEPVFKTNMGSRNSVFEKARSKLNAGGFRR